MLARWAGMLLRRSVIAPKAVLTAGHCVDGYEAWGVYAPLTEAQPSAFVYDAEVYDYESGPWLDLSKHDIGLVYLDEPFVLDSYPELAGEQLHDGAEVVAVGRVIERQASFDYLFESEPVAVFNSGPFANSIQHPHHYFCDPVIEKGDSGGPVYAVDADSPTVVAVNSSHRYLARVDELRDWILERIEAHP